MLKIFLLLPTLILLLNNTKAAEDGEIHFVDFLAQHRKEILEVSEALRNITRPDSLGPVKEHLAKLKNAKDVEKQKIHKNFIGKFELFKQKCLDQLIPFAKGFLIQGNHFMSMLEEFAFYQLLRILEHRNLLELKESVEKMLKQLENEGADWEVHWWSGCAGKPRKQARKKVGGNEEEFSIRHLLATMTSLNLSVDQTKQFIDPLVTTMKAATDAAKSVNRMAKNIQEQDLLHLDGLLATAMLKINKVENGISQEEIWSQLQNYHALIRAVLLCFQQNQAFHDLGLAAPFELEKANSIEKSTLFDHIKKANPKRTASLGKEQNNNKKLVLSSKTARIIKKLIKHDPLDIHLGLADEKLVDQHFQRLYVLYLIYFLRLPEPLKSLISMQFGMGKMQKLNALKIKFARLLLRNVTDYRTLYLDPMLIHMQEKMHNLVNFPTFMNDLSLLESELNEIDAELHGVENQQVNAYFIAASMNDPTKMWPFLVRESARNVLSFTQVEQQMEQLMAEVERNKMSLEKLLDEEI